MRQNVGLLFVATLFATSSYPQTLSFKRTDYPAGKSPAGIAIGDFNKDGISDLVVANFSGSSISVLLGNKDGTFQAAMEIPTAASPLSVAVADFNRDGNPDIALATGGPYDSFNGFTGAGEVVLFAGKGDGTFQSGVTVFNGNSDSANGGIGCVATADLNHDGNPDLVDCGGHVLLGDGAGAFNLVSTVSQIKDNSSIAIADMNGDQKLDLIFSYGGAAAVSLGNGDGSFKAPVSSPLPAGSAGSNWAIAVGDVNGDGKPDLIVAESGLYYGTPTSPGDVLVFLGNGDGTLQAGTIYSASQTFPLSVALVDVNRDGKLDIVTLNAPGSTFDYLNKGDGTFQKPITFSTDAPIENVNASPQLLIAADFNGDGKPDFAASGQSGIISVFLNTSILPVVGAVANGASFLDQPVASGSLVTLFGNDLAAAQVPAGVIPLPTTLSDASVTFNGIPAPLLLVSQHQINAQLPWDVLAAGETSGMAQVVVTRNGVASPPFQFPVAEFGPGIFSLQSGMGQAAAINPDGTLAGPAGSVSGVALHPAKPGDTIVVFATGLGAVTPPIDNGAAPGSVLRNAATMPTILVGGVAAQVAFAGLSPQFVGVNQINVVVPIVPKAGVVPLQIKDGDVISTDKVTIAVTNP